MNVFVDVLKLLRRWSFLRVAGQVNPELPRVLALLVPEIAKEHADRGPLHHLLRRRLRNWVAKDDAEGEVGLAELATGENAETNEAESLENDGLLVGVSVLLPLSNGVGDDGQVVAIGVPVHLDQGGSKALIRAALSIEALMTPFLYEF